MLLRRAKQLSVRGEQAEVTSSEFVVMSNGLLAALATAACVVLALLAWTVWSVSMSQSMAQDLPDDILMRKQRRAKQNAGAEQEKQDT